MAASPAKANQHTERSGGDPVLTSERDQLLRSREYLRLMREDVLGLRAMGGDPVKPPRIREIGRTARGLGIVLLARIRGRGRSEWIEDAWFDLLRQLAWWIGARIGLRRGARIWRFGGDAEPDPSA